MKYKWELMLRRIANGLIRVPITSTLIPCLTIYAAGSRNDSEPFDRK